MPDDHPEAAPIRIGQRLRWTREALRLRQVDWCRGLETSQQTWNNFERGYSRISIKEALKVCDVTGVSLDWIFRGDPRLLPYELAQEIRIQQERGALPRPPRRRRIPSSVGESA
jgi:transcriptional regulator with XRE-family HTH domain